MNEAEANAIAESVIAYCNSSYEENFRIWGSGIYISENTVKNDSESKMYYFDYESLKENLFEKIAQDLPDYDFNGSCMYYNDDGDPPARFKKEYRSGILTEGTNAKKQKLVFCTTTYEGDYVAPETINQIADGAFRNCSKLVKVVLSPSIKKIGKDTFSDCIGLKEVHIPKSVEKMIGKTIFKNCNQLTIYAPIGSCAETYAKENNIPFVAE
jgi:hypothetical protein